MRDYEQDHREPKGPFTVEIYTGDKRNNGGWDLWAGDIEDYQDAVGEAQELEDHGFPWKIYGEGSAEYSPNLKMRRKVA